MNVVSDSAFEFDIRYFILTIIYFCFKSLKKFSIGDQFLKWKGCRKSTIHLISGHFTYFSFIEIALHSIVLLKNSDAVDLEYFDYLFNQLSMKELTDETISLLIDELKCSSDSLAKN